MNDKDEVIARVREAKPELGRLIDTYGSVPYLAYLGEKMSDFETKGSALDPRLTRTLGDMIRKRFGAQFAYEAMEEIGRFPFASTADHGGILAHPFFANAFFARAFLARTARRDIVLTLNCAGISLDNSSFARGIFLHDENGNELRLHLKPWKSRHECVYASSPYTGADITRVLSEIENALLSDERKAILTRLVQEVFATPAMLGETSYQAQTERANWHLMKYIPGFEAIEHISLAQEELAARFIAEHLIDDDLASLFFDPGMRESYKNAFDGIIGAHDTHRERGTHLLWGIHEGERFQLFFGGEGFVDNEGAVRLPYEKEAIRKALLSRGVMPSMALTFIALSFIGGLAVGGGFSQINYLGEMQAAWCRISVPADAAPLLPTTIFTGELVALTLTTKRGTLSATTIDAILYGTKETQEELYKRFEMMPLSDLLYPMMGEYYKIVTGERVAEDLFPPPPPLLFS